MDTGGKVAEIKHAEAGRRGDEVRSDAWMKIEIGAAKGIELDVSSRVEALYGDAVRELLLEGLRRFGVEDARLTVEDKGALPFVLMARLEAVVRRAMPEAELSPWLPGVFAPAGGSDPRRLRRSRLYLPGNQPKFMVNAPLHAPDGLILDLEDSVAPAEKDAARVLVRNALVHLDFGSCEKMVRINQGKMGLDDLEWVIPWGAQLILLPKVESAAEVAEAARKIEKLRQMHNVEHQVWLMPIVESAQGAWFAYEIASAHETIVALAVGLEDYTADIGAQRTNEGRESSWARAQVLNGARAAGVQPIDTVFSDVSDIKGLTDSIEEAKSLGFEGKGCIHPRQIEIVHRGFAPTAQEIEKAGKIVLAFEDAEHKGLGVVSLGSKMIDPPVVKRALRVIRQAEDEGLIRQNWREKGIDPNVHASR